MLVALLIALLLFVTFIVAALLGSDAQRGYVREALKEVLWNI